MPADVTIYLLKMALWILLWAAIGYVFVFAVVYPALRIARAVTKREAIKRWERLVADYLLILPILVIFLTLLSVLLPVQFTVVQAGFQDAVHPRVVFIDTLQHHIRDEWPELEGRLTKPLHDETGSPFTELLGRIRRFKDSPYFAWVGAMFRALTGLLKYTDEVFAFVVVLSSIRNVAPLIAYFLASPVRGAFFDVPLIDRAKFLAAYSARLLLFVILSGTAFFCYAMLLGVVCWGTLSAGAELLVSSLFAILRAAALRDLSPFLIFLGALSLFGFMAELTLLFLYGVTMAALHTNIGIRAGLDRWLLKRDRTFAFWPGIGRVGLMLLKISVAATLIWGLNALIFAMMDPSYALIEILLTEFILFNVLLWFLRVFRDARQVAKLLWKSAMHPASKSS